MHMLKQFSSCWNLEYAHHLLMIRFTWYICMYRIATLSHFQLTPAQIQAITIISAKERFAVFYSGTCAVTLAALPNKRPAVWRMQHLYLWLIAKPG